MTASRESTSNCCTEADGNATLYLGDSRVVLKDLPDNSVDSAVKDPPYELTSDRPGGRSEATRGKVMGGFMGMKWDATGIANDATFWAEVLRILKPGGHLLAFSHARTYHRMVVAIEDAGFEIRDQIMWIYGSGFPKSKNLAGENEGWGTALKPAHEPIVVARKPLVGTVASNMALYGTGAINIDACRIPTEERLRAGSGVIPMRNDPDRARAGEASASRRYTESGATNFAATPGPRGGDSRGRWPANVIHDGSAEVVDQFPNTRSGLLLPRHKAGGDSTIGTFNIRDRSGEVHPGYGDTGSAARFFYCAKASKTDRDVGMAGDEQAVVTFQTSNGTSGRASSLSADRDTKRKNTHPTVKPTELMRYLVRLVTPPGGVVLDAFMGSGSTGRGCILEGRRFIGIEREAQYFETARQRIAAAAVEKSEAEAAGSAQLDMFSGAVA